MARSIDAKCRKCRRAMEKLFLKGDRCFSPKCGVVKRNYAPGVHGKKGSKSLSEYGLQLSVKQKVKRIYGVLETQFRKHFDEVKNKKGITGDLLLERLEMRFDNVVYRMGLASSRAQARQLVNHGSFNVNGRPVDIPSYEVKVGDEVKVNKYKTEKTYFKNIEAVLKNRKDLPSWIEVNPKELGGKVLRKPDRHEAGINVNTQVIVEYYSR